MAGSIGAKQWLVAFIAQEEALSSDRAFIPGGSSAVTSARAAPAQEDANSGQEQSVIFQNDAPELTALSLPSNNLDFPVSEITLARIAPAKAPIDFTIMGTAFPDELEASNGANYAIFGLESDDDISGANGSDELYGEAGNDILDGKAGADTLYGGPGADSLLGGRGDDIIYFDADDPFIDGGQARDTLIGTSERDIIDFEPVSNSREITNIEVLRAGGGNDVIVGPRGGGGGALEIHGEDGNDIISLFGNNADTLNGYAGADLLFGGDGNDLLYPGAKADEIDGGAGVDVFYIGRGDGANRILDSDHGNLLALFHGWNNLSNYTGVSPADVSFSYGVQVSVSIGTASATFDPGVISSISLWDHPASTARPPAYTVHTYNWDDVSQTFQLA